MLEQLRGWSLQTKTDVAGRHTDADDADTEAGNDSQFRCIVLSVDAKLRLQPDTNTAYSVSQKMSRI